MIYDLIIEAYKKNIDYRARVGGHNVFLNEKTLSLNVGRGMGHSWAAANLLRRFSDSLIVVQNLDMRERIIREHSNIARSKVVSFYDFVNGKTWRGRNGNMRFVIVDSGTLTGNCRDDLNRTISMLENEVDMFILLG